MRTEIRLIIINVRATRPARAGYKITTDHLLAVNSRLMASVCFMAIVRYDFGWPGRIAKGAMSWP